MSFPYIHWHDILISAHKFSCLFILLPAYHNKFISIISVTFYSLSFCWRKKVQKCSACAALFCEKSRARCDRYSRWIAGGKYRCLKWNISQQMIIFLDVLNTSLWHIQCWLNERTTKKSINKTATRLSSNIHWSDRIQNIVKTCNNVCSVNVKISPIYGPIRDGKEEVEDEANKKIILNSFVSIENEMKL